MRNLQVTSSNPYTIARSVHQLLEFHLPLTVPGALRSRPGNRIDQPDQFSKGSPTLFQYLTHRFDNTKKPPLNDTTPSTPYNSPRMSSAAFSPTMYVDTAVNVPGILGYTLASTTLNPLTPLTLNLESNTAIGSPSLPIGHVQLA